MHLMNAVCTHTPADGAQSDCALRPNLRVASGAATVAPSGVLAAYDCAQVALLQRWLTTESSTIWVRVFSNFGLCVCARTCTRVQACVFILTYVVECYVKSKG